MSRQAAGGGPASLTVDEYVAGVSGGDRKILARAITLIESRHAEDLALAGEVLSELLTNTGGAVRVGISGIPGVGKSTFIDALGSLLIDEREQRVAVLAVDPSSVVSGGSILGDKSRMPRLSARSQAFVRPSPSAHSPGGVGRRTRESLLLCEAAGYDVVLVETVGVGQSEVVVAEMVDTFLVLLMAGAGDELQGIKKGILELADLLAVNKADGENRQAAEAAQSEYRAALRYLPAHTRGWQTPVLAVSGLTGEGMAELWEKVLDHRRHLEDTGALERRRREQSRRWMWSLIDEKLEERFRNNPAVRRRLPVLEGEVLSGNVSASQAADELLALFAETPEARD